MYSELGIFSYWDMPMIGKLELQKESTCVWQVLARSHKPGTALLVQCGFPNLLHPGISKTPGTPAEMIGHSPPVNSSC